MSDDLVVVSRVSGKVIATHRSDQSIILEKHYPEDQYGPCEILLLPDGVRVKIDNPQDPRKSMTDAQVAESMVLSKAFAMAIEAKLTAQTEARSVLISEGKYSEK